MNSCFVVREVYSERRYVFSFEVPIFLHEFRAIKISSTLSVFQLIFSSLIQISLRLLTISGLASLFCREEKSNRF